MGIKGKIYARKSDLRIESMEVGSTAYLDIYDVMLTRKALFVDRLTPVITKENMEEDDEDDFATVHRIGPGLTQDDFEIDFSKLDKDDAVLPIENESVYQELIYEKDLHIIFENPDIEFVSDNQKEEMSHEDYLEFLNAKMEKAVENQDFPEAGRLKKQIEKETNKKESHE